MRRLYCKTRLNTAVQKTGLDHGNYSIINYYVTACLSELLIIIITNIIIITLVGIVLHFAGQKWRIWHAKTYEIILAHWMKPLKNEKQTIKFKCINTSQNWDAITMVSCSVGEKKFWCGLCFLFCPFFFQFVF